MKAREARKNQANTVIKEMKLRPKIDPHDYETKKGHVVRFLKAGRQGQDHDHVPRTRAVAGPSSASGCCSGSRTTSQDLGFVESSPKQDGRNMIMVLGPHKKKAEAMAEAEGRPRRRRSRRPPSRTLPATHRRTATHAAPARTRPTPASAS